MKNTKHYIFLSIVVLSATISMGVNYLYPTDSPEILSTRFNPKKVNISLFWKNSKGEIYKNIEGLKSDLDGQKNQLKFSMNAGMFDEKLQPTGLYVENGKKIKPLNTKVIKPIKGKFIPNFYLQPNGVFYITTDKNAGICKTADFPKKNKIKFATQSGPMLLIDGKINKLFSSNSTNYNIRNGVGILPNNEVVFAISKNEVNFYDFAKYFKELGCSNALYLDGFVSKAFIPEQGIRQMNGQLGVLIGVTEK